MYGIYAVLAVKIYALHFYVQNVFSINIIVLGGSIVMDLLLIILSLSFR